MPTTANPRRNQSDERLRHTSTTHARTPGTRLSAKALGMSPGCRAIPMGATTPDAASTAVTGATAGTSGKTARARAAMPTTVARTTGTSDATLTVTSGPDHWGTRAVTACHACG